MNAAQGDLIVDEKMGASIASIWQEMERHWIGERAMMAGMCKIYCHVTDGNESFCCPSGGRGGVSSLAAHLSGGISLTYNASKAYVLIILRVCARGPRSKYRLL